MGYRYDEFSPNEVFHIYSRGVESRKIFRHDSDRNRFRQLMLHCLRTDQIRSFSIAIKFNQQFTRTVEGEGQVDLLSYCLMPNHMHLLVKENTDDGVSKYMQRLLNSYAKYFNMSQKRSGSLFTNPFKAVLVDGDDQLLHVSRYIHLNAYVAHITDDIFGYSWSSLNEYIGNSKERICHEGLIKSMLRCKEYRKFMTDEADYARTLADCKHLLVDHDD